MSQPQQRRSIKNVVLTQRYHMPYMGTAIFLSLSLLSMLYGLFLYRYLEMAKSGSEAPIQFLVVVTTLVTTLLGLLIVGSAVLAAHRIAGVHIKIRQTCDKIAAGDFDTRIRFRKEDQLEDVAESFNRMLDVLNSRRSAAMSGESQEAAPDGSAEEGASSETS